MTLRTLIAEPICELPELMPLLPDTYPAVGFGLDGEILVARPTTPDRLDGQRNGFPVTTRSYEVVRIHAGLRRRFELVNEPLQIGFLQPLGDEVLLVQARCQWGGGNVEPNAAVCGSSAQIARRFALGDGIADVRTAPSGAIWVSYFDEGVFGNRGSHPGPPAIGSDGLVRFDAFGRREWSYDSTHARTDQICDAYAFNLVREDDAWVYHYTEFPIVRVAGANYTVWQPGVSGAIAMAVRHDAVLLFGDHDDAVSARVYGLRSKQLTAVNIVDHEGARFGRRTRAFGVGPVLYLLRRSTVFSVNDW